MDDNSDYEFRDQSEGSHLPRGQFKRRSDTAYGYRAPQEDREFELGDEEQLQSENSSGSDYMKQSKRRRRRREAREGLHKNNIYSSKTIMIPKRKPGRESQLQRPEIFLESEESEESDQKIGGSVGDGESSPEEEHEESLKKDKDELFEFIHESSSKKSPKQSYLYGSDEDEQVSEMNLERKLPHLRSRQSGYRAVKLQESKQQPQMQSLEEDELEMEQMGAQEREQLIEKRKGIKKWADGFSDCKARRAYKYLNGRLDVNVRYLHELVYYCYEEDLISNQLMLGISNMGLGNSLEFIQKYNEARLSEFNFSAVKFTIFDHRRLVGLLKEKATKRQYTDEKPLFFLPYELHVFMSELYALPTDTYDHLAKQMDKAYGLVWWETIGTELKGRQHGESKEPATKNLGSQSKGKIKDQKRVRYRAKFGKEEGEKEIEKIKYQDKDSHRQQGDQQRSNLLSNQSDIESNSNVESRKHKTEKQSFYSSSIFDSEKFMGGSLSFGDNSHSLEDLSDLLGLEEPSHKKKTKGTSRERKKVPGEQMKKKSKGSVKRLKEGIKEEVGERQPMMMD